MCPVEDAGIGFDQSAEIAAVRPKSIPASGQAALGGQLGAETGSAACGVGEPITDYKGSSKVAMAGSFFAYAPLVLCVDLSYRPSSVGDSYMKSSLLGAIAVGAGGAAIAGFGASAGRDVYKAAKKSTGFFILLGAIAAALCLPFIGMRNVARGHAPGEWWKAIRDILLVPIGIAIGVGIGLFAGMIIGKDSMYMTLLFIGVSGVLAAAVGTLVGLVQRPGTKRRYAIMAYNEAFLANQGIRETGEAEISHYDGKGNALRLMERTPTSIVFMVVGKRNKRAYINLSWEGEMTGYSDVVALGSSHSMDTAA